jgi:hypothetical protein
LKSLTTSCASQETQTTTLYHKSTYLKHISLDSHDQTFSRSLMPPLVMMYVASFSGMSGAHR